MSSLSLGGKTALVTGAASGIGRAIALALASAGARIAVNHLGRAFEARQLVNDIAAACSSAVAIEAAVSRSDRGERLVGATEDALGPIDTLVNNPVVFRAKPCLPITE